MSETPPSLTVSGESPMGEGRTPILTRVGGRRVLGPWRWLPVSMLGALLAVYLAALGAFAQYRAPWWAIIPLILVMIVLVSVVVRYGRRITLRVVTRRWGERGLPPVHALSYAIEDDALVVSTVASTTRLRWPYVSEVAPAGKRYWVLPAAGVFYFVPRRFFPTSAAETAFLNAMLARMTPAARDRSVEARRLAAFE